MPISKKAVSVVAGEEECPNCGTHFKIILEPVKGLDKLNPSWEVRFQEITRRIRQEAQAKGLAKLTPPEINRFIHKLRKERAKSCH